MADVTFMRTSAETKLGEQFDHLRTALPAGALLDERADAFARFAASGLPHRRIEAWHYTDLRGLLRDAFPPSPMPSAHAVAQAKASLDAMPAAPGVRIVLLDGLYQADLSSVATLPQGVSVGSTLEVLGQGASPMAELLAAEKLGSGESVLALNAAFMQGGAVVSLAGGVSLAEPIELVSFVSGALASSIATRSLFHLGHQASATIVERHVSLGQAGSQANHVLVFALGDGAALDHVATLEGFSATSLHLGTCLTRLGADTRFSSFTLIATPGVTRRQSFLEFTGPQSSCWFGGVSLLDGRTHADTTLVVTHTAPHCESREYYKTILDGESTGIYQGKVVVAPGAQKTDGKMLSKAIFLADGASMFNKPELEIFADDVVCGHGATVGYLDADQLFYLRARGIPMKEAQALLLNAFAADAIEGVTSETLRNELTGRVEQWLRQHRS